MNNDVYYGLVRWFTDKTIPVTVDDGTKLIIHKISHFYYFSDNLLFHSKSHRIVIPENRKQDILSLAHDHPMAGHLGIRNTFHKISRNYYWPGMAEDIKNYITSCAICQKRKRNQDRPEVFSSKITPKPFYHVGIDVIGPLPMTLTRMRYVIVAIDFFTKWVEAKAVSVANAHEITQFLYEDVICRHGIPYQLTSDRGTEFVNELIESLTLRYKIRHIRTTAYHPQGNGQTERTNRTLKDILSKITEKKNLPWDFYLPSALFAIRTIQQESTRFSPAEILYGRNLRDQTMEADLEVAIPVSWESAVWSFVQDEIKRIAKIRQDAYEYIQNSQARQRKQANQKIKEEVLKIGDKVLVYRNQIETNWSAKLEPKWDGPYFVQRIKGTSVWLRKLDGTIFSSSIHRSRLKKFQNA